MSTIKGPAVFLAQFMGNEEPFNNLDSLCKWAANLGYKGIQIPTWETALIDLDKAANSQIYCDELKGKVNSYGLEITELSTHLQGQLVAVNPAYDTMFDGFAPDNVKNNPKARTDWAIDTVKKAGSASGKLGLTSHATFSGALLWHTVYPWPQRPNGLVTMGFEELAKRWTPILNHFDEHGVDVCYELHPGEDLHDGVSFERFLEATNNHKRANILYDPSHFVLQQLDYLAFIDIYHERIKAFHVKDAEFNSTGKQGVYGGYSDWVDRAGRFRSLGDGQTDFAAIFSKLTQYNCDVWAVMEWECCLKSPEQGASEGAPFIQKHIIEATQKTFDDFAGGEIDKEQLKTILGLSS
ncbi:sugar phosphate isomerase/epimerase [Wenyingzhuangia sp. 2_MG-2023]|uniref:sugar phosphate isomerase/epimerase family protein n=1 Tax=Wenyingzhuangia sp. 2_MG-2023 TaxID=3062639 RepID=UPI0026E35BDA|nr:sugar phosphate isomerase/epimerase [Wenyingzhuangia sp. 2_MG-2023]MDO6737529.1 sugar phosphate isomerase/epimerase [Wenyingzhuangia sp. 2_MG-2023]